MSDSPILPQAFAIFCDDVRREVGGKLTFIGVYQSALYAGSMPGVIPQLFCVLYFRYPLTRHSSDVEFKIFSDERLLASKKAHPLPPIDSIDPSHKVATATAVFQFVPFEIVGPGLLRARAYIDGEEVRAGTLRIELLQSHNSEEPPHGVQ